MVQKPTGTLNMMSSVLMTWASTEHRFIMLHITCTCCGIHCVNVRYAFPESVADEASFCLTIVFIDKPPVSTLHQCIFGSWRLMGVKNDDVTRRLELPVAIVSVPTSPLAYV